MQYEINGNTTFSWSPTSSLATVKLNPTVAVFYRLWEWLIILLVFPLWPFAISFDALTLIVFARSSLGTTKTTRMYYLVIAAADMTVVVSKDLLYGIGGYGIYAVGIDKLIPGGVLRWVVEKQIGCASNGFVWFTSEIFLNYVYVVLDAERFIALYFPFKVKTLITKRKMATAIVFVFLYSVANTINWFWTLAPVRNPYIYDGIGCSGAGVNPTHVLVASTLIVTNDYVASTFLSTIFTVLIVFRIKSLVVNRHKLGAPSANQVNSSKGLSAKQMEYFLTPLIISILHILFFIPLAVFRLTSNILPYVKTLNADESYFLYGFGFDLYQLVMPVHLINFLVYYRRIPGFAKKAKSAFLCRYSEITSKGDVD